MFALITSDGPGSSPFTGFCERRGGMIARISKSQMGPVKHRGHLSGATDPACSLVEDVWPGRATHEVRRAPVAALDIRAITVSDARVRPSSASRTRPRSCGSLGGEIPAAHSGYSGGSSFTRLQ